jgi:outer membrane receptor for ferrienterochelin and colicin
MSTSNTLRRAIRYALFTGAAAIAAPAMSQEASEAPVAEVIVTGSRIIQPNQVSTSPVVAITNQDIKTGGKLDVTDVLNDMPQINSNSLGQDLGNRTSGLSSAGGVATANLRGLGPNRTLVLVNGKRLGAGSPNTSIQSPAPDIDQIPSALLERVEVVTGGASAVYGSDAIAGVVNFITRQDYEGFEIDYQYGENWHDNSNGFARARLDEAGEPIPTGTVNDGGTININLIAGTNIADGRGNITAYFGYLRAKPVKSGSRDFGGCQLNATEDLMGAECAGSGNSNYFEPVSKTDPNGLFYSVLGNEFVEWGTVDTNPPALFNSQPYIYIGRDNERFNGGFQLHYDVSDAVRPYAEFSFMNDRSYQEIAPSALFIDSNPLEETSGGYLVNCSNPLLSAQQRSIICTPQEIAIDTLNPGAEGGSAVVRIGRRNVEGGGRSSTYQHTNFRAVGGLKGDFADAWNYDAYAQYYYTTFDFTNEQYLNFEAIGRALQVTGTRDNPVCIRQTGGCVPYNIFSDGGVTQDQIDPLYTDGTARGDTTLKVIHADITGDLGAYGLKLPSADDGIAFNIGYENRREAVFFAPDAASESGLLSGAGGASTSIDNSQSVDEVFTEVRVPLVQGKTGIHDLVFDTGYRYSDYSLAGGVDTYKFEVQYAPVESLRFRGGYQRAIRAPSIIELFNPERVGQIQFGNDPCAPSVLANGTQVAAAAPLSQCINTGVTPAQYGNGTRAGGNTVPQGQAGQLTQMQAGNEDLTPEKADTYSIGITYAPSFLPSLVGSIDYYNIKLEDAVGVYPANVIMNECLATGNPTYCTQLVRSATGGLTGASVESGGYIVQRAFNIGAGTLEGIDVQTSYTLGLPETLGSIRFALNGAYLIATTTTPFEGAHEYDCAGLFGSTCQTVNPKWRHNLRTSWLTPWDVDVHLTWRYMGHVNLDNNDQDETLRFAAFGEYNTFNARIESHSYFDLAANWDVTDKISVRGGVNNVLDKDPPIVTAEITSGGAANTYEFYDLYGRQMFIAMNVSF